MYFFEYNCLGTYDVRCAGGAPGMKETIDFLFKDNLEAVLFSTLSKLYPGRMGLMIDN
jgi:hypothetical protein